MARLAALRRRMSVHGEPGSIEDDSSRRAASRSARSSCRPGQAGPPCRASASRSRSTAPDSSAAVRARTLGRDRPRISGRPWECAWDSSRPRSSTSSARSRGTRRASLNGPVPDGSDAQPCSSPCRASPELRRARDQEPEHLIGEAARRRPWSSPDGHVVDLLVARDRRQARPHLRGRRRWSNCGALVSNTLSKFQTTASALKAEPSWNFTPSRSLKVHSGLVGVVDLPFGGEARDQLARACRRCPSPRRPADRRACSR